MFLIVLLLWSKIESLSIFGSSTFSTIGIPGLIRVVDAVHVWWTHNSEATQQEQQQEQQRQHPSLRVKHVEEK